MATAMRRVIRERRLDLIDTRGARYVAVRLWAEPPPGTRVWHVWLEFVPKAGGPCVRTGRQTTQPTLDAVSEWAAQLRPEDLEGAFRNALRLA